jgi:adenosylhomocysteine nucleosidase
MAGAVPTDADRPHRPLTVALLAALIYEVRPFLRAVKARPRRDLALPVWEFAAGEGRGVVGLSGVGETATRRAAARLLTLGRPQVFMSVGFGGGLTPEVDPGALVLGASYYHYSPKTEVLREISLPVASPGAADLARRLTAAGAPAFPGSIVTASVILDKARLATSLQNLAYPVLDQETGAAAEVSAAHGLPFLGLRAVTDAAGEEIPGFIAEALSAHRTPGPGMALGWLARDPRRFWQLVHYWRRSNLAARNLARALALLSSLR